MKEKEELHQRKITELRREIQVGIDQAGQGKVSPFNEAALEEVETKGRERLKVKKASKSR